MGTTDLILPVASSTVFHRPMGEFVETPRASSGSGLEMDPSSIDMARHKASGNPISSSYYSDAWIEGTAYVLPSRDPFQEVAHPSASRFAPAHMLYLRSSLAHHTS